MGYLKTLILIQGIIPILGRLLNSRFLIRKDLKKRMLFIGSLQLLGWIIFIATYYSTLNGSKEQISFVGLATMIQFMAFTLLECTFLGYMKNVPQELTISFNIGRGCGKCAVLVISAMLQFLGFSSVQFLFLIALLLVP